MSGLDGPPNFARSTPSIEAANAGSRFVLHFSKKPVVSSSPVQEPAIRLIWLATALVLTLVSIGCLRHQRNGDSLPDREVFSRDQLRIHSDVPMPRNHRLIEEITARRRDIASDLLLPLSDEPINIYVFENVADFEGFVGKRHSAFPDRRAIFVRNDTTLNVYAWWGEHVGEDLRHEVTHGYLHSVVPGIPLWLDEGLAEYYERPRGSEKLHEEHVASLVNVVREKAWSPDLRKLESLRDAATMSQLEYAESWLWVHYLMRSGDANRQLLQDQLARLRMKGDSEPVSMVMGEELPLHHSRVLDHLGELAAEVAQSRGSSE